MPGMAAEGELGERNPPGMASSPYATGGGGVSFAHRVAAVYLTGVLTKARRAELGDLPATSVSFQTAPRHPVDDLLVVADSPSGPIDVAIACRATPSFVPSHKSTVDLIASVLEELEAHQSPTGRVVIAVAGWRDQWQQVAQLCEIARTHGSAAHFDTALTQDGIWGRGVRDRYSRLQVMVERARPELSSEHVVETTWRMLERLWLIGFEVQPPRDDDWASAASALDAVAHERADGVALRDALVARAAMYDKVGAKGVDVLMLQRDLHGFLASTVGRSTQAWDALAGHRRAALASVRDMLKRLRFDAASF